MKKLLAAFLISLAFCAPASAQMTKSAIVSAVNTDFPSGCNQCITAALLRTVFIDVINSYLDFNGSATNTCATDNWVSAQTTTSSTCTQPSFSSLSSYQQNEVSNVDLSLTGAYTFKGNPTSSSATPQDFTIAGLTQKSVPTTSDLLIIADEAASGAIKKAAVYIPINGTNCVLGVACSVSATATSFTPGTTTVLGATAPCALSNTTGTTSGCVAETGTGNFVLSASPTLTGTITAASENLLNLVASTSLTFNASSLATASLPSYENVTGLVNAANADSGILVIGGNDLGSPGYEPSLHFFANHAATIVTPTAMSVGDLIGNNYFHGYNGSAYGLGAEIYCAASQNWTGSAQGTSCAIYTTPNNSTTPTLSLTIGQNQSLTVAGALSVGTTLTFSSIPTGTPAAYACFTSSGQIVSSSSAC